MNKRRFKKAARKAWRLVQGQRSARLTWREVRALEAFARAYPQKTVKNWELVKDPRPRYLQHDKTPRRRRRPANWAGISQGGWAEIGAVTNYIVQTNFVLQAPHEPMPFALGPIE